MDANRLQQSQMTDYDSESARLVIRLDAIVANYRTFQRLAGPAVVGAVVKADAYGTGAARIAQALASEANADTFFVARIEEGIELRPVAPRARIFVLDGVTPDTVAPLLTYQLTPVLNSLAEIAVWSAVAREAHQRLDAAIHVDTGMNRLGMPGYELPVLAGEQAKRLEGIRTVLVMSHLACADDPNAKLNAVQLERFKTALTLLPAAPASLSSSAGVLLGKDYLFDMVRAGIGLYGGNPQPSCANPFASSVRLTGRVLQVRRVDKGESVGYGATFRAKRPTVIATVALGYADGLMRAIGNRGQAALAGVNVPVVGRVSMDLITLDVSDILDVRTGAEVEFIGDNISLENLAEAAGTASYEILTSLPRRIPRDYTGLGT
jgi:alanine racemase